MKVMITGANGFVGRHLMNCLDATKISLKLNENSPIQIESDAVIHLAGIAHNSKNKISTENYEKVNRDLTIKVFNAFLKSTASKFIMMSSVKAVRDETNLIIDEETLEKPSTDYGKSKLAAEQYLLSKDLPSDKYLYILRPALITGSGAKGNLLKLKRFSRSPLGWLLYGIKNKRSYCDIRNLCFVIQEILDRNNFQSGVYIIADDEPLSTSDVVKILAKNKKKMILLSRTMEIVTRLILSVTSYITNGNIPDKLDKISGNYLVSNKKIKAALGKPLPYKSIDGISKIN